MGNSYNDPIQRRRYALFVSDFYSAYPISLILLTTGARLLFLHVATKPIPQLLLPQSSYSSASRGHTQPNLLR